MPEPEVPHDPEECEACRAGGTLPWLRRLAERADPATREAARDLLRGRAR